MKALICVICSQKVKGVAAVLLCAIALTKIGILYEKSGLCPLTPLIGLIVLHRSLPLSDSKTGCAWAQLALKVTPPPLKYHFSEISSSFCKIDKNRQKFTDIYLN